jgi:hypothetical protein
MNCKECNFDFIETFGHVGFTPAFTHTHAHTYTHMTNINVLKVHACPNETIFLCIVKYKTILKVTFLLCVWKRAHTRRRITMWVWMCHVWAMCKRERKRERGEGGVVSNVKPSQIAKILIQQKMLSSSCTARLVLKWKLIFFVKTIADWI